MLHASWNECTPWRARFTRRTTIRRRTRVRRKSPDSSSGLFLESSESISSCLLPRSISWPQVPFLTAFFATGFFAAGAFLATGFFATAFFATGFFAAGAFLADRLRLLLCGRLGGCFGRLAFYDGRLRRGQPCQWHAVRRAGHVAHADPVAELHRLGVSAVLTADADLEVSASRSGPC